MIFFTKNKPILNPEDPISFLAKASNKGDATSGKIIIESKGKKREFRAVVFTSSQSTEISQAVDKAYARSHSESKSRKKVK